MLALLFNVCSIPELGMFGDIEKKHMFFHCVPRGRIQGSRYSSEKATVQEHEQPGLGLGAGV